jgi:hypothetical protein
VKPSRSDFHIITGLEIVAVDRDHGCPSGLPEFEAEAL